ncbi:MAG: 2-C-methyl-D-erythritol 2,4-cyclodiphosphate synthase [Candidatus Omnitrophica bacterium]|nr:2-C-methyl-D-erythritol 2,4-cyclodiphosphate synthase [Candidatus Omnitrophota bacterium]
MQIKTGLGYDIHRLIKGRKLILGGVEIPFVKGLDGHSDADVLIHAVCDALLGALGIGDIGEHFPNSDPKYKGISSLILLKHVAVLVQKEGYAISNIDSVILAEEPNLKNYKKQMRLNISAALGLSENQVNIKATTNEKLGAVGREEGLAAFATVLLLKT